MGDATHSHYSAMDREEALDWWVVVLVDVPADQTVALREACCVEPVGEVLVCLDLLGKQINRVVHVHEETVDGINTLSGSSWDADGVRTSLSADGLCTHS